MSGVLSGLSLSKEAVTSQWGANVLRGADTHAEREKLRFMQQQAVKRARKIMALVGWEESSEVSDITGGGRLRVSGRAVETYQVSEAIDLPHTGTYARIEERQDLWYRRRPVPLFLGGLALENEPYLRFRGYMQVAEYPGEAAEESSADEGDYVSYVGLPEFADYGHANDYAINQLGNFIGHMQALSVTLELDPRLDD